MIIRLLSWCSFQRNFVGGRVNLRKISPCKKTIQNFDQKSKSHNNHQKTKFVTPTGKPRCRIEKEEKKEREHKPVCTWRCTRPEVSGKDAMKKDDRNHPNSMQHGNYRIETWKIRENMIKPKCKAEQLRNNL